MDSFVKIILIILFIICLFDLSYNYYQVVRHIGVIGFGVIANNSYNKKHNIYFLIWLASAVLINPYRKITLGVDAWKVVDVIWMVLLCFSLNGEDEE